MKRFFLIAAVALVPQTGFGQGFPENPVQGARLFAEKGCFKCHSILGQGGRVGHDLGRIELKGSRLNIASAMLNNAHMMSNKMEEMKVLRPHLTGEEMESLIAYLYYVNYFDDPGVSAKGREIFESKGCARCHGPGVSGSSGAPPLASFPRNISPIYMAKTLWNHGPRMRSEMTRLGIAWPRFEKTEMMDLVAYMKEAAGGNTLTPSSPPGNPNEGLKVFQSKGCPQCHGDTGSAGGTASSGGTGSAGSTGGAGSRDAPNLANRSLGLQESLTQTVSRLWNHAPQMFARAGELRMKIPPFTEKEMADLVSYIYFLNYFDPPPEPALGRRLFAEKQCVTCHSLGGGIQGTGPDLALSQKASSPIEMTAAMWNHVPFMQSMMREMQIPWPRFEKGDLNNLAGYIQSMRK